MEKNQPKVLSFVWSCHHLLQLPWIRSSAGLSEQDELVWVLTGNGIDLNSMKEFYCLTWYLYSVCCLPFPELCPMYQAAPRSLCTLFSRQDKMGNSEILVRTPRIRYSSVMMQIITSELPSLPHTAQRSWPWWCPPRRVGTSIVMMMMMMMRRRRMKHYENQMMVSAQTGRYLNIIIIIIVNDLFCHDSW